MEANSRMFGSFSTTPSQVGGFIVVMLALHAGLVAALIFLTG